MTIINRTGRLIKWLAAMILLLLSIMSLVLFILTIWYLYDIDSYNITMNRLSEAWLFINDYAKSVALVVAGRFSSNFKDNMKGIFTAVVMLSTFLVNIARYKSIKKESIKDGEGVS